MCLRKFLIGRGGLEEAQNDLSVDPNDDPKIKIEFESK